MRSEKTARIPAKRAPMHSNAFRTHYPKDGRGALKAPLKSRICECGCGQEFVPVREWQRFKSTKHRKAAWAKSHEAENQIQEILRRLDRVENRLGISKEKGRG